MKVLMTADTIGGVWTYTMELCRGLALHDIDVILATMGAPLSPEQHKQVQRLDHVQLYESRFRLCWMDDSRQDVARAGHWLMALERELRPDVIHLNDLGHGGLPWRAPVLLVAHSCVFSWWDAVKKQNPPREQWRRYRTLVRGSVQQSSKVAAPTEAMLAALLHFYGPARSATTIANGRDFPPLAPVPGVGQPMIFSAGRLWDEAKNLAQLAAIAPQIPWPIYLAGKRADFSSDPFQTKALHCLGFLAEQDLARWLERASIYVAPAHYEPFGLGILEAARAGCTLVLGDIPSLKQVWGDAAVYVDPNNPKTLQRALTTLIEHPSQRQLMAERAWRRAQSFSTREMTNKYINCYRTLKNAASNNTAPTHFSAGAPL